MKEIIVGKNEYNKRLDSFLQSCLPAASKGFLYKMLRKKNITLNDHKATGTERLMEGDKIHIFFSEETIAKFAPDSGLTVPVEHYVEIFHIIENRGKIGIVYENDDFLIVDKPAGLLSQKSTKESVSLNEWLIGYLIIQNKISPEQLKTYRPSVVNRLDRNTSGLVLCACNLKAARLLSKAVREREIRKKYLCVVHGKYNAGAVLRGSISKDNNNTVKFFHGSELTENNAKFVESHVRFLEFNNNYDVSLLEIELVTGRTHQIRASLFAVGFPIVGDPKYFDKKNSRIPESEFNITHQLLHSHSVEFPDDFDILTHYTTQCYFSSYAPFLPLFFEAK